MDSVIWLGVVCGMWDEGLRMRRLAWRCVEVFLDTVTFLFLVYTPRNAGLYTFHLYILRYRGPFYNCKTPQCLEMMAVKRVCV
jgi:hypothetical protein